MALFPQFFLQHELETSLWLLQSEGFSASFSGFISIISATETCLMKERRKSSKQPDCLPPPSSSHPSWCFYSHRLFKWNMWSADWIETQRCFYLFISEIWRDSLNEWWLIMWSIRRQMRNIKSLLSFELLLYCKTSFSSCYSELLFDLRQRFNIWKV